MDIYCTNVFAKKEREKWTERWHEWITTKLANGEKTFAFQCGTKTSYKYIEYIVQQ